MRKKLFRATSFLLMAGLMFQSVSAVTTAASTKSPQHQQMVKIIKSLINGKCSNLVRAERS